MTNTTAYSEPFAYGYGDAVKCLDCGVILAPSLVAVHDALHTAGLANGATVGGQACGVCGQRFAGSHTAHYAAAHKGGN